MTDLTELRSADAYCHYLSRRHYENFSVVSLFLRSDIRTHLSRIYAFCRTTDDFGDESPRSEEEPRASAARGVRTRRLELWRDEVRGCFAPDPSPIHPVLIALMPTINECGLSEGDLLDLIQANIQDQTVSTYETWDDLRRYCMLSAAPVGRMVLAVFGVDNPVAKTLSDDVCIGLQLANHAQDVKRDAVNGRSYLLESVIRSRGHHQAVRDLCDRADELLMSGTALEAMVPLPLRAQLALYRLGGLEVVRSIRRLGYRTDESRPAVSTLSKFLLLIRSMIQGVARIEHATPQRAA